MHGHLGGPWATTWGQTQLCHLLWLLREQAGPTARATVGGRARTPQAEEPGMVAAAVTSQ